MVSRDYPDCPFNVRRRLCMSVDMFWGDRIGRMAAMGS